MRTLLLLIALLFSSQFSYAAFPSGTVKHSTSSETNEAKLSNNNLEQLNNGHLSVVAKDQLTQKRLSFFEKMVFKIYSKHFIGKMEYNGENDSEGFNVWGFLLGLFLGPLGLIASFVFSKDRNFRKWTWWGFRLLLLIATILVAIAVKNI